MVVYIFSETQAGLLIVLPILQSLWEEHDTGSRLAMVNPYFLGSDIPQSISKPCIEEDEVSQLTVMKLETIGMFTFHKISIMESHPYNISFR